MNMTIRPFETGELDGLALLAQRLNASRQTGSTFCCAKAADIRRDFEQSMEWGFACWADGRPVGLVSCFPDREKGNADCSLLLDACGADYREAAGALLARARNLWGLEASSLRAAPEALGRRALKLFLEEAGCGSLEKKHLDQAWAALAQGGRLDLPGGTVLTCAQGVLWAGRAALPEPYDFPVKLGENPLPGGKILVLEKKRRAELEKPEKIQNLLFKNALDCDIMTGTLRVRSRRAGDRFAPAGRGLSKPLKQVLQELRVPAPLRSQVPLLAWGQELVWVQGAGAGERLRVREETRNVWTVAVR